MNNLQQIADEAYEANLEKRGDDGDTVNKDKREAKYDEMIEKGMGKCPQCGGWFDVTKGFEVCYKCYVKNTGYKPHSQIIEEARQADKKAEEFFNPKNKDLTECFPGGKIKNQWIDGKQTYKNGLKRCAKCGSHFHDPKYRVCFNCADVNLREYRGLGCPKHRKNPDFVNCKDCIALKKQFFDGQDKEGTIL